MRRVLISLNKLKGAHPTSTSIFYCFFFSNLAHFTALHIPVIVGSFKRFNFCADGYVKNEPSLSLSIYLVSFCRINIWFYSITQCFFKEKDAILNLFLDVFFKFGILVLL